jgi:chemotaxis signal transduction protein
MNEAAAGLATRVADLRYAFDRAFAVPVQTETAVNQDLLAIRVGGEPYAIRLSEVGGVFVDRPITHIPANNPSLLGIGGFRGAIVPVHSLPILFGHSTSLLPRWLVIAATAPIALAFDLFEGHLRVLADTIVPQQPHAQMRSYAPDFVQSGGVVRPVLQLASVIASLSASDAPPNPPQRRSEQP